MNNRRTIAGEFSTDAVFAAEMLERKVAPVYDSEARDLIRGKTILVTDAGGSIGSEIIRQLKSLDSKASIYFIDNDEYVLYKLQLNLTGQALLCSSEYFLADITNRVKMNALFDAIKPEIVFHAAAHKYPDY